MSETQISLLPDRLDSNAIRFPSGEMLGAVCSRDEAMTFRACACGSAKSRRQMFVFVRFCVKASRLSAVLTAKSVASWPTGSLIG